MKKLLLGILAVSLVFAGGCAKKIDDVKIKSETDKTFYAVGAMFGSRLAGLELTDDEIAALAKGLSDSAKNKKLEVGDLMQYQQKVQEMFRDRMMKGAEKSKKAGVDYLEKFIKEGATKTASGLAYKILKEGTGKQPKETDVVEVHYHGTLIDGTVFDSSVERGKKVSFPLNRVIKGWTEGLQLLKEGGKIKLVIPAELGYGDNGAPPKIPGGATLVFEVELFSVQAGTPEPGMPAAKAAKPAKK